MMRTAAQCLRLTHRPADLSKFYPKVSKPTTIRVKWFLRKVYLMVIVHTTF